MPSVYRVTFFLSTLLTTKAISAARGALFVSAKIQGRKSNLTLARLHLNCLRHFVFKIKTDDYTDSNFGKQVLQRYNRCSLVQRMTSTLKWTDGRTDGLTDYPTSIPKLKSA